MDSHKRASVLVAVHNKTELATGQCHIPCPYKGMWVVYHSFDVIAKDWQKTDKSTGATLSRPHCYAAMIQYAEMQQVCMQL